MPTRNPSKPLTRSPSRPLSNQTAMTGSETDKTITPSTPRPNRARPPAHMVHGHRPAPAPPQYANPYIDLDASFSADQAPQIVPNGNRVPNGVQYEYDPRMPPPPVPVPLPAPIEHTKDRKKGPKIFGISLGRGRGRSRPGSPRDTNGAANPSGWAQARRRLFSSPPSISPERHDPSSNIPDAVIAPRPRTAIPQAGGGSVFPPPPSMRIPERSQSSPPRVSPATSTRNETCSPLLGFGIGLPRIFGGRSRAPSRDRERSREKAIWKGKEKERPIFRLRAAAAGAKKRRKQPVVAGDADDDEAEASAEAVDMKEKGKQRFILFVGNLKYTTSKEAVQQHFAVCDPPPNVRLLTPKQAKPGATIAKSKGCAFLEFSSKPPLQQALKLHHSELESRKINVELTAGGGGKSETRLTKLKTRNKELAAQREKRLRKEGGVSRPQRFSATSGESDAPSAKRTWTVGDVEDDETHHGGKSAKKRGKRPNARPPKDWGTGVNSIPVG
ncbi:hypothetical protein EWM64_g5844 [Hericium alpestre]|uniref:RRM domain-containing protein n=1 Tax=Hericium alpestre TaxID=135208 RepID=A0A4Y9ZTD8_9AGAM|nr:hypothetical protein EWM64_g5844 [Hericium alpestre]